MERFEVGLVLRTLDLYPKFTILFGWDVGSLSECVTTPLPDTISEEIPEEVFDHPHKYLEQVVAKTSIPVDSKSELGQFLVSAKAQPTAWETECTELLLLHICEGAFRRGILRYVPPSDREFEESLHGMYKLHPWMEKSSFGHLPWRMTVQKGFIYNLLSDLIKLRRACYGMGLENKVAPILPVTPPWRRV